MTRKIQIIVYFHCKITNASLAGNEKLQSDEYYQAIDLVFAPIKKSMEWEWKVFPACEMTQLITQNSF